MPDDFFYNTNTRQKLRKVSPIIKLGK